MSSTSSANPATLWAVFGGNGWIGQQFCALLAQRNIPFIIPPVRADHTKAVRDWLESVRPSRVVSLLGRTHGGGCATIDYLERGREQLVENIRDNLFAPLQLALWCHHHRVHFTYLGTGCIFSYDQDGHGKPETGYDIAFQSRDSFFHEIDEPNFYGSSYSIVKGFTDRLMHLLEDTVLQLRIRMPINEDLQHPRNFLTKILTYRKVCSIVNSMTVLPDLLPVAIDMIQEERLGTWNLTNPGAMAHNEILDMYKHYIDPSFRYENFTQEEQSNVLAADRSNNVLDTTKLERNYFVLPLYQSLQRLFKRIRKEHVFRLAQNHQPKNILVTGGYGFIGSNFLHFLQTHFLSEGLLESIVNVDKRSYCSLPQLVEGLQVTHYETDINETEEILSILQRHRIDTVVHFAAQSHVDRSFDNSLVFTMDNTRGTHSLLEASRRYGNLQKFVHISTDEVYGENLSHVGFKETTLPNPSNPYAATKIAAEFLVNSYFHCFELPVVILRGNNVYGPRQFPEKLVPKSILAILHGIKCTVHGNGLTHRSFLHVDDMCSAVATVMRYGRVSEVYNAGSNDELTVLQMIEKLVQVILGPDHHVREHVVFVSDRYYNDFTYRIDATKLKQLGWEPKTSLHDGLKQTIRFYQKRQHTLYAQLPLLSPSESDLCTLASSIKDEIEKAKEFAQE